MYEPLPPSVSIVIPIYNRAALLNLCLPPLFAQSYPQDRYEILLIDDGSSDDTVERAREIGLKWDGKFRIIEQTNGGPAKARNSGLFASQADIIAFVDSDCVAEPRWLEILINALTHHEADAVGGPIVGAHIDNWVSFYLETVGFYRHRIRHGKVDYLVSGNIAVRRNALLAVGGFTTQGGVWGEDVDLSYKLIREGYKLIVSEQGVVTHYGDPTTLRQLIHNLFRYGKNIHHLSKGWKTSRQPAFEFIRHLGAAVLSPYLALRQAHKVGLLKAITFVPLIIAEHLAFCAGSFTVIISSKRKQTVRD